ncbi:TPA: hypothetical protein I7730_01480 [Vibrio vulnificus]|uniref:Uncharacterized protein n=1 Tax=Vibrio vulnificus TaxID=672 RepID=A0A8H9MYF0_VIBVL|nr:hypothetical protein [Vibrio vulnificus]
MLPTSKGARLSAIALAKSLNVSEDVGRELIAACFQFTSWDALCSAISNSTRTPEPSQLDSIHEVMMIRLCESLEIEPNHFVKEVVKSISPFSKKPTVLALDLNSVRADRNDESGIDLGSLFQALDKEQGFGDLLDMMADDFPDDMKEFLEDLREQGPDDFQNRLRLSRPLEPYFYLVALDALAGWDLSDESLSFEHGEPVFYWLDSNEEENPVFLNSTLLLAGDTGDVKMLESVLGIIEDSYSVFEKPILLFGNVASKEINGQSFAVVGIWFDGSDWRWLFLSNLSPEEQKAAYPEGIVDNLENTLMAPPPPASMAEGVHDDGTPMSLVYHCMVHPVEDPTGSSDGLQYRITTRPSISGYSGWKSYI